jgi:hypothetical protein
MTHNIKQRQTPTFLAAFEPTVPASEQPQIHASDHMATGISLYWAWRNNTFVLEDSILLKYDAVSMGSQIRTLPQNVGWQLAIDAAL